MNNHFSSFQFAALLPSLAPLHLMLADAPWPHGFGATLANVGPLSKGFERSVASPLQPRRLRAMGRTVWSISSLPDNHSNCFQVAVRVADKPGVSQNRRPQSVYRALSSRTRGLSVFPV